MKQLIGSIQQVEQGKERCAHGLIKILSWHLPRGTEKNQEMPQSG